MSDHSFNAAENLYMIDRYNYGYGMGDEAEALIAAKKRAIEERKDVAVYKAVQVVKYPLVTDKDALKVEKSLRSSMSYMDDWDAYMDVSDEFDSYKDYLDYIGSRSMANNRNFFNGYNYYDTADEAVRDLSRRVAKNMDEGRVYQAIKLVAPQTPNVTVTEITLA